MPIRGARRRGVGRFGLPLLFIFLSTCGPGADERSADPKKGGDPAVPRVYRQAVEAMGTVFSCSVLLDDRGESEAKRGIAAAFEEISRIESLMSSYRPDSALSKINLAAGEGPVKVPRELRVLIEQALEVSKRTSGKFDITFGPLGRVWPFKDPHPAVPSPEVLAAARALVDYRKVTVDPAANTVFLAEKGMSVGLGAIAKGYGVDRAAAVLEARGFSNFIFYGGGDIYMAGKKGTAPWRVGVQDPRNRKRLFADFDMWKSGAVVTSGDYEQFFTVDGKRYHHILDPDTGYPAEGVVSATVLAPSVAAADALATGIVGLGIERGMALIESDPSLEGILVDPSLAPHVSSGLESRVTLRPITGAKEAM